MIRPLRSRHRSMFVALAVIVPVLFVAGLTARRAVPPMPDARVATEASGYEKFEVIGRDDRAWGEALAIRTLWLRAPADGRRRAVTLELEGPVKRPDLLVYWDDRPGDDSVLSDQARLLGSVGGQRRVTWEVAYPSAAGRLVLYSMAWNEVLGSTAPPAVWGAAR